MNAIYVTLTGLEELPASSPLPFDDVPFMTGGMDFDDGAIIINEPGMYVAHWWVSLQSAVSPAGARFRLVSDPAGIEFLSGSEEKIGQIVGTATFEVTDVPVTLSLLYEGDGTAYFPQRQIVKAAMLIAGQEDAAFGAGARFGTESFELNEGVYTPVPLSDLPAPFDHVSLTAQGRLAVEVPGVYAVDAMITGVPLFSFPVTFAVTLNNAVLPAFTVTVPGVDGQVLEYSATGYLDLSAGDELGLALTAAVPAVGFFQLTANRSAVLSVHRVT